MKPDIYPLGDSALIVRFSEYTEAESINRVRSLFKLLKAEPIPGLIELVPALGTLAVYYRPDICGFREWRERLLPLLNRLSVTEAPPANRLSIPVCYGGEFGPDLPCVAESAGLSEQEVIRLHSGAEYVVGMIGFVPGFPYLVGLPHALATPRRTEPRVSVPPGSIGIGGNQTGIYPVSVPGGWRLIGRTPVRLFRPEERPPSLLSPGDIVRFIPIERGQFAEMEHRAL